MVQSSLAGANSACLHRQCAVSLQNAFVGHISFGMRWKDVWNFSIVLAMFSAVSLLCHGQEKKPVVAGLPGQLVWQNAPLSWESPAPAEKAGNSLSITAGEKTDLFISPFGDGKTDASPRLLFVPADDFVFSARVTVGFRSTWDAGALVVYAGEEQWAKLCLEKTVDGHVAIISVVTNGTSDDSTHFAVEGDSVYLQIAKAGQAIFLYASSDGEKWNVVRAFSFGRVAGLRAGFSAQAPTGDRCSATFTRIRYEARKIDLFAGK